MNKGWKTDIFLSDRAFLGLNISCIEVYARECHGSLLGYHTPHRIVVEYAFPYQSAKRKPTQVEPNWRRELKVKDAVERMTQLQHVGYFHSHTQWGDSKASVTLSAADREWITAGQIEIIVAINQAKRRTNWYQTTLGELCGSLGEFHIRMAGYYKRKKRAMIVQYPILCPYALGFDYTFS